MNTQKLVLDDGLLRLDINGNGILKFNPSDFNVYDRFMTMIEELPDIEKRYVLEVETETDTEESEKRMVIRELARAKAIDAEVKQKLSAVFGYGNDFDKLLGGVNLMAVGSNGERVITNLLEALMPYVQGGLERYTKNEVAVAKANREQRRAAQKGVPVK